MIIVFNMAILFAFLMAGSISVVLWGWAIGRMYRGEPILTPERRLLPQVGVSELLIGFGVMVLTSALIAPVLLPKKQEAQAGQGVEATETESPDASKQDIVVKEPKMDLDTLVAIIVVNSIATLSATMCVLLWMKFQGFSFERAGFLPTMRHVGIGIVGAVMILPPVMVLQGLLASQIRYEHPLLEVLKESISLRVMIAMAASASLIAPLVEEVYFRGLMQGFLEKLSVISGIGRQRSGMGQGAMPEQTDSLDHSRAMALSTPRRFDETDVSTEMPTIGRAVWPGVVTSIAFALAHAGQGPAPISLFFLALGIAYLYRQTGSIWPGLIIHFVLNATSTGVMIVVTVLGVPVP